MAQLLRTIRTPRSVSPWRSIAILLASLALAAPTVASAAELYKVIDEEGNVTFSQFPPSKDQGEVENVKVAGASDAMTTMTRSGNIEFCGDIELPSKDYYRNHSQPSDRFLRDIGYKRKSWQQRLQGLEKRVNQSHARSSQYRNSSYRRQQDVANYERQEAQLTQIRDLRCALHWADERDSDVLEYREQNHTELKRLEGVQKNLLAQLQRNCGGEPPLDPSDEGTSIRRKEWTDCSKQYHRDLREVSRQLQTVSREISATLP